MPVSCVDGQHNEDEVHWSHTHAHKQAHTATHSHTRSHTHSHTHTIPCVPLLHCTLQLTAVLCPSARPTSIAVATAQLVQMASAASATRVVLQMYARKTFARHQPVPMVPTMGPRCGFAYCVQVRVWLCAFDHRSSCITSIMHHHHRPTLTVAALRVTSVLLAMAVSRPVRRHTCRALRFTASVDNAALLLLCCWPGDCDNLQCVQGTCARPTCMDGIKNQGEVRA